MFINTASNLCTTFYALFGDSLAAHYHNVLQGAVRSSNMHRATILRK